MKKYTSISLELTCNISINVLLIQVRWRFYQIQGVLPKLSNPKKNFVWTPCIKVLTKIVFVCFQGRRRFYQRRRETASYQRPPAQSMAAVWISRKFTACANRSHYLRFVLHIQHKCRLSQWYFPAWDRRDNITGISCIWYRESPTSTDSTITISTSTKLVADFLYFLISMFRINCKVIKIRCVLEHSADICTTEKVLVVYQHT